MASLPQYGGEGKGAYKGNKSDSSLRQLGGEGSTMTKGGDSSLLKTGGDYRGPGATLNKEK